ncbi:type II toxin-antitoxin system RelB/DinJ family antitoxin [Alkalibacterium olivapovliticus]|uniref:DNA-damage-inducible protein J n=1 Tax=Alkalibacterium olivapovliticus TaxID=99907 RepID=A0A2T0W3M0_9LACT|nr:type II toxin-antitoxin system RelB/DinJ family antitoxin [Alkalibacterium olivapovliticus]PRY80076.1 DNA-damage-inducible protein J [Alkalibacterium olivapovliticus]
MSVKEKKRVQVQIDKELAEEAELIFNELGLNQTAVLNAFYKRVVADGGLPFELKLSEDQKAFLHLLNATKDLPVEKLSSKEQVDAWFKDEEQDY